MTVNILAPLTANWQHIHADWWQDDQGNDIHRVEIDDDALYHCHLAGSPLPWDAVTTSLAEAKAIFDERLHVRHDPEPRRASGAPSR
jgi:hypothetical protein